MYGSNWIQKNTDNKCGGAGIISGICLSISVAKIHFFQNCGDNSCKRNIKYRHTKCGIIIEPILRLRAIVFTASYEK
jgi:hypothetical protein